MTVEKIELHIDSLGSSVVSTIAVSNAKPDIVGDEGFKAWVGVLYFVHIRPSLVSADLDGLSPSRSAMQSMHLSNVALHSNP